MSTSGQALKVRPAAGWYLVTVVLWLAAAVLAAVAWKPIFQTVQDGVTSVGTGAHAQVSVPDDGLTVYATRQPSGGDCSLVDAAGDATPLDTFDASINWALPTNDGLKFYGLGSTPSGLAAGTYTLRCTGLASGAQLGTGKRIDVGDVARLAILGVIVPLVFGFIGLVVLIVLLVMRHNSKTRNRAAMASGYPGGWQPGGYPPPPPGG
jgi:hypothetical protein